MVAPQPAEDEPTVPPLPPISAAAIMAAAAEPAPAEPIDELAETWVPPWEQLAEEHEPAAPAVTSSDEAIHLREPAIDETVLARSFEPIPEERIEPELAAPEPVRYSEPSTDVLQEVPDWLRTPAPRRAVPAPEPEPEIAPEPVHEEELEIPDWLVAPAAATPPPPAQVVAATAVEAAPPPPVQAAPARAIEAAPPPAAPTPIAVAPPPAPLPVAAVEAEPMAPPVAEVRRRESVPPVLPPAAARKAPARAPRPKAAAGLEDRLVEARHALAIGDYGRAAAGYAAVIKRKYQLDTVTTELEVAVKGNPKAAPLWQALGDAYMKGDRLPDAISAYERGMAAA
jgi:hypothetical protein